MAKKSPIRIAGKKILIVLNILISVLILYPLFFSPTTLIWINGFLGLIIPYLLVLELLLLFFWLVAKPIIASISLLTMIIGWKFIYVLFGWHPGNAFPKNNPSHFLGARPPANGRQGPHHLGESCFYPALRPHFRGNERAQARGYASRSRVLPREH